MKIRCLSIIIKVNKFLVIWGEGNATINNVSYFTDMLVWAIDDFKRC